MRCCFSLPAFSLCCVLLAAQSATAQKYVVIDLGTLPSGKDSEAMAINESGQVTGLATVFSKSSHEYVGYAFLYSDSRLFDLGSLGGAGSIAYGIAGNQEDRDERKRKTRVTGWAVNGQGDAHAFLYQDGFMKDMGLLPGGSYSAGQAVNAWGEVAGWGDNADRQIKALIFKGGNILNLGTLGGDYSVAFAINDWGDVTGFADTAANTQDAFLYKDGEMIDLGELPGGSTSAIGYGINASDQVAGTATTTDAYHGFLYEKGKMIDLGLLPKGRNSFAYAINSFGQVVGMADKFDPPTGYYQNYATLYSGGHWHDLNDMIAAKTGLILQEALGINDRGEIVGVGTNTAGEPRGFLLRLDCGHDEEKR